MKQFLFFLFCLLHFNAKAIRIKPDLRVQYGNLPLSVNPFIGTGGHGHTFPGPTMPFGACQLSPDTRLSGWDGCGGYHYSDSVIYGFSHTHLSGTGCSDYGDILLMPVTKEMELNKYQYASRFSHKKEKAHAGYYEVYLNDPKVHVALTATLHGGVHRYTYPDHSDQYVVLDLQHRDEVLDTKIEQLDDYTIRGYRFSKAWALNQRVYFEIRFSKRIMNIVYDVEASRSLTAVNVLEKARHVQLAFESNNEELLVKCAISNVDAEGAHENLQQEMYHDDFKAYVTSCENQWQEELSKISFNDPLFKPANASQVNKTNDQKTIFYTALYHTMIHPSLASDVDGRYRGRDDKIHSTSGAFNYYSVFSLWDTYRGLHPLLTIIDKQRTNDFIRTFIQQYEEGGRLPIWELSSNETNCMIGYHVVSVIWDAYNKGIRGFDAEKAFEAMKSIATNDQDYDMINGKLLLNHDRKKPSADAEALESYNRFGLVRTDDSHESVSKTLEYAFNDWCIAQMAQALGKTKDYQYYMKRSQYWKNVYDPTTGFMRARKNGSLYEPFSPYTVDNNYTEANSWQYSFYVPHDVKTLIQYAGGNTKFEKSLDNLFSAKSKTEGREQADITGLIGQYAHGNEPSHHIIYFYNLIGKHEKALKLSQKIMKEFYKNQPDGLIGNEDCGQMSAWYVLNAMGLYSFCPGEKEFVVVDRERFKKVLFRDASIISTTSANSSTLSDDKNTWLSYFSVQFPSRNSSPEESKSGNNVSIISPEIVVNPYIVKAKRIFDKQQQITLQTKHKTDAIYFSLNDESFKKYDAPFIISENTNLTFYAKNSKREESPKQYATFTKLPSDRMIILKNEYNKSYHANGASGLMDGIYGRINWRAGDWQGYQGQDIEVIMAFKEAKKVSYVAANFLEDQNAWIFYPKSVSFYGSTDSTQWELIKTIPTNKSDHNLDVTISKFSSDVEGNNKYKFIKLSAANFGPMPQWHEGRGFPTFIFIDEFEVK